MLMNDDKLLVGSTVMIPDDKLSFIAAILTDIKNHSSCDRLEVNSSLWVMLHGLLLLMSM